MSTAAKVRGSVRRRRRTRAVALLLLACSSACSPSVQASDEPEAQWDTWFPHAEPVKSSSQANAVLPFASDEPDDLNEPRIYLSPTHDAIAFIYDTQAYGRVVVVESLPDIPDATEREISYRDQVDQAKSGRVEIVSIRGGLLALVSTAEDESRSAVEFVLDDIQMTVLGPKLSAKQALEIAEHI